MAAISETDLLAKVKNALGITGSYQDDTLSIYIEDVKEYLRDGGVCENLVNDTAAIGVISRGVADLWNYGSGEAQLSTYFMQRAAQLALKSKEVENNDTCIGIE